MGFSLIEVLVAMVIAAMALTASGTLLSLVVQQKSRSIVAASDVGEAMSFMRLVDRLFSDVGAGADALVLDRSTVIVSGFGLPRGLAASAEALAVLAREPSGPGSSRVTFTIARFEGDAALATSRRTETVLTDLERFGIATEVDGRWVLGEERRLNGAITRIRFSWLRKGGRPRVHDVEVRRGVATACIRSSLARGCSMLTP